MMAFDKGVGWGGFGLGGQVQKEREGHSAMKSCTDDE